MKNKLVLICLLTTTILHSQQIFITKFGAKPGVGIDNTAAIQKAIDNASSTSGTVVFPDGRFETGTIHLKSNITILLMRDAMWTETASLDKFEKYTASVPSRCEQFSDRNFILAMDKENITIEGEGTIDGNGHRPEIRSIHLESEIHTPRPWGLHFINCKNIRIRGIKMQNSSYWMQRYFNCDHVVVDGISVFNHGAMNSDGIDIDCCHDFILSNSTFDATDDAICLKSEGLRDCKDIVITNCIARCHASAIKLGTGSMGGFKNIVISNCVVAPSRSKEMLHTLGCWRGLVGLEILCVDGGITENIAVSNLVIDSSETPIHIKLGNRLDRNWREGGKADKSILRNISLNNIIVKNAGPISSAITGYPGSYVENVTISNLTYEAEGSGTLADTTLTVEENSASYPVNRMYYSNLPSYGLYARHVNGLYLSNVIMRVKKEDKRSAVTFDDVKNAKLEIVQGQNKSDVCPLITIAHSSDIRIIGDAGINRLEKLLKIYDLTCKNIGIYNAAYDELSKPATVKNFKAIPACKGISVVMLDWSEGVNNISGVFEYIINRNNVYLSRSRSTTFTDIHVNENTRYTYEIIGFDAEGRENIRKKAEVVTIPDNVAPVLESWRILDNQTIELLYSESISPVRSCLVSGYSFTPGIDIRNVVVENNKVIVSLKTIKPDAAYTLKVTGVYDNSQKGNAAEAASLSFTDSPLIASWTFDDGNAEGRSGKGLAPQKLPKPTAALNFPKNISGNITVSCWFKLDDAKQDKYMRLVSNRQIWNEPKGFELEINPAIGRINFCGGAISPDQQGVVRYTFDTGWHHLAAMICDSKTIIYIDGKKTGEDTQTASPAPTDTPLHIGCAPSGQDVFNGLIDELKIFNRALGEEEIMSLQGK